MLESLKSAYRVILAVDDETPRVTKFVRNAIFNCEHPVVLDIGCGYGRTLRRLKSEGIDAIGIDVNPEIVAHNNKAGFKCYLPKDFVDQKLMVDVVVMSHVVEHFAPRDLLEFMNTYLELLRPGGFLVIATPLMSDHFFDDFDHVRPYQPLGISMVFGSENAQVQYRGRCRLSLVDLWFRRSPLATAHSRGRYLRGPRSRFFQAANLVGAVAFRLTSGLIGRTTGWVGLYRKH